MGLIRSSDSQNLFCCQNCRWMLFTFLVVASFCAVSLFDVSHVVSMGSKIKMVGVDAVRVVTAMQDVKPVGDFAAVELVRNTVGITLGALAAAAADADKSVAKLSICARKPKPTSAHRLWNTELFQPVFDRHQSHG